MDPLLFMIIINVNDALVRKMLAQQCPFQRAGVKAKRTYLVNGAHTSTKITTFEIAHTLS